jgi:hypothetical protein
MEISRDLAFNHGYGRALLIMLMFYIQIQLGVAIQTLAFPCPLTDHSHLAVLKNSTTIAGFLNRCSQF